MNKSFWYISLLVLSIGLPSYAMEQQDANAVNPHLWQQYGQLLPYLTVIDPYYQNVSQFDGTAQWNLSRQWHYQQAFKTVDPLHELEKVAEPWSFTVEDFKNAKPVVKKKSYTFPLANFGKGVLLKKQGDGTGAKNAFDIAKLRVGYKPHEAPVEYASLFALALQEDQHDDAYRQATKLLDLRCHRSWKHAAAIQLHMLANLNHTPSIKILAELGFGEWQYRVVQDVCEVALLDNNTQPSQIFTGVASYIEQLKEVEQLKPYAKAVRRYRFAAEAFSTQEYASSCKTLQGLLSTATDDKACKSVQQLGEQLFKQVAATDDWSARCYFAEHQLNHTDKKMRREGVKAVQKLIQALTTHPDEKKELFLHQLGLITALQNMANNNHGTAPVLLAQWACSKVLVGKDIDGNKIDKIGALQQVKQFAEQGLERTKSHKAILETLCAYADSMMVYYQNQTDDAAQRCIQFLKTTSNKDGLIAQLTEHVRTQLVQLADQNNWYAQCWQMSQLLEQKDTKKNQEGAQLCCQVAEQFLVDQTQEVQKYADSIGLFDVLQKVATSGNARASFLLSRYQLHKAYKDCNQTGLSIENIIALDPAISAIKLAVKAKRNGASDYAKALLTYKICLNLITQEDYKKAEDQLFALLLCNVPEADKALFDSFAHYHLKACADEGYLAAGCWCIQNIFDNDVEQDQCEILKTCNAMFERMHTLNILEKNEDFWQKLVKPLVDADIIKKVEAIACNSSNEQLQARACYILSLANVIHVGAKAKFIDACDLEDNVGSFEVALQYAKKACEFGKEGPDEGYYKDYCGGMYYSLGICYQEHGQVDKAIECFEGGYDLQDSSCMRHVAQLILENSYIDTPIDEESFKENIALLEKAYEHGDQKAGELLATHYYEGKGQPFACGHALGKDAVKAYRIAHPLLKKSPQIKRIVGYVGCAVEARRKECGEVYDFVPSVKLLLEAATGGDDKSYAALAQICLDGIGSRKIFRFLELKSNERIPAALCATGLVFLGAKNLGQADRAIECFEKAVASGQPWRGHYHLTELYTHDTWKRQDLPKAVEHCCAMIDGIQALGIIDPKQKELIGQLLVAVQHKIDVGCSEFKAYQETLIAKMALLGVKIRVETTKVSKNEVFKAQGNTLSIVAGEQGDKQKLDMHEARKAFEDNVQKALSAYNNDKGNKALQGTLISALKKQLLYYHRTYIPEILMSKEECKQLFYCIGDAYDTVQGNKTNAAKLVKREAARALYQLGLKGFAPATVMYITHYLRSQSKELQDNALDLVYRSFKGLKNGGALVIKELGLFKENNERIAYIKKLADKGRHAQAAFALYGWYSLFEQYGMEGKAPTAEQRKQTLDKAFDYCTKAKEWGCQDAVPAWHMLRLYRHKTMKEKDFKKAMNILESVAGTNVQAADLLITMYTQKATQLPCGHSVKGDRQKAQQIALKVKDKSITALRSLIFFAREDKEYETMLLYGFDLVKRGALALSKLGQTCVDCKTYPAKIMEYLENNEDAESRRLFAGMLVDKGEVERGMEMLRALIEAGDIIANFGLAVVHADTSFGHLDVAKAVKSFGAGLKKLSSLEALQDVGVVGYFDEILSALCVIVLDARKQEVGAQEKEAMAAVQEMLNLLEKYDISIEQSTKQYIGRAMLHADILHEYSSAVDDIEFAIGVMQEGPADIERIIFCVQQILTTLAKKIKEALNAQDEVSEKESQQLFDRLVLLLKDTGVEISMALNGAENAESKNKSCEIFNLKNFK